MVSVVNSLSIISCQLCGLWLWTGLGLIVLPEYVTVMEYLWIWTFLNEVLRLYLLPDTLI